MKHVVRKKFRHDEKDKLIALQQAIEAGNQSGVSDKTVHQILEKAKQTIKARKN